MDKLKRRAHEGLCLDDIIIWSTGQPGSSLEEILNFRKSLCYCNQSLSLKVHEDEKNSHKGLLKFIHSILNGFNRCQLNMVMLKQCPYTGKTQIINCLMGDNILRTVYVVCYLYVILESVWQGFQGNNFTLLFCSGK